MHLASVFFFTSLLLRVRVSGATIMLALHPEVDEYDYGYIKA
jgi:hypothetical protein